MKIIHTSDIRLGSRFVGLKLVGDKLRAGLKDAFTRLIDLVLEEKADLLLIAGNLFDTPEISKNLQDFVANQIGRLEPTPTVIVPGQRDSLANDFFWQSWESFRSQGNIFVFTDHKNRRLKFEQLNCTVYGYPYIGEGKCDLSEPDKKEDTKFNIGVVCGDLDSLMAKCSDVQSGEPLVPGFDYLALGGQMEFMDLSCAGFSAAFSGSPEQLDFGHRGAGFVVRVEIDESKNVKLDKVPFGKFVWRSEELRAEEILNNDDLIERIKLMLGHDVLLRVKLAGLALFEAGLDSDYVQRLMEDEFLYLDIVDEMAGLPENISEVKVTEKKLLGQYIKVMAERLNKADENLKPNLEKSFKIGYALLEGREPW